MHVPFTHGEITKSKQSAVVGCDEMCGCVGLHLKCEKYVIVGEYEYDHDMIEERLSPGTRAKIKYFEGGIAFFRQNNVEEVYANGECLVSFSPAEEPSDAVAFIYVVLCIVLPASSLKFLSWNIKHIRQLEEKRDRRIAKKYGKAQR